jgi:hypothetical protein
MAPDPLGGLRSAACPVAPYPASLLGGRRAAMHLAVPCELWASNIKKNLAGLPVWVHPHVSKAPDIRAIMGL